MPSFFKTTPKVLTMKVINTNPLSVKSSAVMKNDSRASIFPKKIIFYIYPLNINRYFKR